MRETIKDVSLTPVEFIAKAHAEDQALSVSAKEIKDRPLVFVVRKMTREDRLNLNGLIEIESRNSGLEVINMGSVSRYLWKRCVLELKNVLLNTGEFESLKGDAKNAYFDTEGEEAAILECIGYIQKISALEENETKK